ncbi:MAG: hypothetical protein J5760_02465 [Clostridia bacterium]|nr:hypothetical protein [Clostridia bacterium]
MATAFQEKMFDLGICDERRAAFTPSARVLPGGEYGIVLLAVKGNALNIHGIEKSEPQSLLYSVELNKITDLKIETGFPKLLFTGGRISFRYCGQLFEFVNCGRLSHETAAIREESQK